MPSFALGLICCSLREHVGRGVTQDGEALRVLSGDGLDGRAVRDLAEQVAQFTVDAHDEDGLVAAEQVRARRALLDLAWFAVDGQGDVLGHGCAPCS